jgi:hypothetical protein
VVPGDRLRPWPSQDGEVLAESKRRVSAWCGGDKRALNILSRMLWGNAESRWKALRQEAQQEAYLMMKRLDR